MAETLYCATHSDTPTSLRCSNCGKPICPQCMVQSPVGFRCQECGRGPKLPTYDVPVALLLRAAAAALLIGVSGGLAVALIVRPLLFGLLYIAAMGGYGYVMGEAVSAAANRKRGRQLQLVAGGGILICLVVLVFVSFLDPADVLGFGLAAYVGYLRLR